MPSPGSSSRAAPAAERPQKGRGAGRNDAGRFERQAREPFDDGWDTIEETPPPRRTEVLPDHSRGIIATNDSPDIGFEQSINPYRGCEHGCIYCYARPSHGFLGLSSGLDFETRIFAKHDAAAQLEAAFARPGYVPKPIALGTVTDPYQPIERRLGITRGVLEVLARCRHPVGLVTKSAGVLRDLDLLQALAGDGLVRVTVSITTLDRELARRMEPRAAAPGRRLEAIRGLAQAGVPVGVNMAPVIPGLTDHEIETLLAAAAEAGARWAGRVLLRLPFEVKDLFADWLETHYPLRKTHVLSRVRATRAGRLNDPDFHSRFAGAGTDAELIAQRFRKACRRHGLNRRLDEPPRTDLFRRPGPQGDLFD